MSFKDPLYLFALLLLPLAVAAWMARRNRVRRYAIRFPATASAALAVGRTSAWRAVLPMALLLASVAALVVALAKPQRSMAVPVEKATIMLVTDHSRSMEADDVAPDRLAAAQDAANTFLKQVPPKVNVGIVAFSTAPDAVQTPTTDRGPVRQIINAQFPDGATNTGDALQIALNAIKQQNGKSSSDTKTPSAIVLLSDGKQTTGRPAADLARQAGTAKVPIYTVALGTQDGVVQGPGFGGYVPVPPDPQSLSEIANLSGGKAFTAEDSGKLSNIYKNLGSRLGSKKRKREITAIFVAGGLILLLGAAASSTRFAPRLP